MTSLSRSLIGLGTAAVVSAGGLTVATANTAHAADVWDRVAQCESGGNWSINTGNGFYGGLQFTRSTWLAYGGGKYAPTANQATKAQQIEIAKKTLAGQGPGAWPVCSQRAGLTRANGGASNGTPAVSRSAERPSTKSSSTNSTATKSTASKPAVKKPTAKTQTTTSAKRGYEAPTETKQYTPKRAAVEGTVYVVQAGDWLSKIADRFDVDGGWPAIAEANQLSNPDLILVGQELVLPN